MTMLLSMSSRASAPLALLRVPNGTFSHPPWPGAREKKDPRLPTLEPKEEVPTLARIPFVKCLQNAHFYGLGQSRQ